MGRTALHRTRPRGCVRGLPEFRLLQRRHVHRALRAPACRAAAGARAAHAGAAVAGRRGLLQQRHRPQQHRGRGPPCGRQRGRRLVAQHPRHERRGARCAADHRPAHGQRAARQRGRGRRLPRAGGRPGLGARQRGAQPALQEHGQPLRLGVLDLSVAAPPGRGGRERPDGAAPAAAGRRSAADRSDRPQR
ncbi:hypothetical protein FQZ97_960470 [compost metagenome]